jgi:hypothetical protein
MQVRLRGAGLLVVSATVLGGCSLITVPVKAVGSLAETVVTTTGTVVTAPFGGGEEAKDPTAKEPAKTVGSDDIEPKK